MTNELFVAKYAWRCLLCGEEVDSLTPRRPHLRVERSEEAAVPLEWRFLGAAPDQRGGAVPVVGLPDLAAAAISAAVMADLKMSCRSLGSNHTWGTFKRCRKEPHRRKRFCQTCGLVESTRRARMCAWSMGGLESWRTSEEATPSTGRDASNRRENVGVASRTPPA